MHGPFESLLDILRDGNQPIPKDRFSEFSDPGRDDLACLRRAWLDISPERRRVVISELGRMALEHFEFLFEPINRHAMQDPDPQVRSLAIENLWESEDPDLALPLLAAVRTDSSSEVRAAAAKALGKFVYLAELEELSMGLRNEIEETLLTAARRDAVKAVRRRSVESLGYSSRQEVRPLIEEAYDSPDLDDRLAAITAMGRSADEEWGPDILGNLQHSGPVIRAAAARAAGELELRESIPDLIELLEDVHQEVQRQAIWALGQLGGVEAKTALSDLMDMNLDDETSDTVRDAFDHLIFLEDTRDVLRLDYDEAEDPFD
jgi:HEAT repeat protein